MCGRFDLHTPRSWIAEHWFGITRPVGETVARYNTPPGTSITMIHERDGEVGFEFVHWGFRLPWAGLMHLDRSTPRPRQSRPVDTFALHFSTSDV